ncbi:multidrug DMT transporter permease [Falsochrobactrum shanghaiense]|uniref:Multidrug DMT transporter permease n=1 Tax=Falsochrobactrum shanghaiense TaxID=2201899 RepID=A0A316JAQ3_9HYPH|nr:iron uptake system protein EfeO [Falsochrobactrum shanghaiense]PWL18358.1 multidrug DMT transporter permease [Falsochrobactrum shanghaiense]
MRDPGKTSAPSRLMPVAVAISALLAIAGAGLFYYATQTASGPERGNIHKVVVGAKSCDPMDFSLSAGRATFEIHNASDRPIEWEILDGVMVVEERENIAPGFHSLLTARLKPGTYEITCGLLSNPRGKLTVAPSESSEAERAAPPVTAFIGPLSEFKVYLALQSAALVKETGRLSAAIDAGNIEEARAAWLAARLPYRRMEAVMGRIADLENAIDPLSDYLEKREEDPAFTGFHRIEYGLWDKHSVADLAPVAAQLLADVTALKERLRALKLAPADLASMAERQAERLATAQIITGEDRWSGADLPGIEANLDGIAKGAGLLLPLVREAAPDIAHTYEERLAGARAALAATAGEASGYPSYGNLDQPVRERLATAFADLGKAIAAINPAIGLE